MAERYAQICATRLVFHDARACFVAPAGFHPSWNCKARWVAGDFGEKNFSARMAIKIDICSVWGLEP